MKSNNYQRFENLKKLIYYYEKINDPIYRLNYNKYRPFFPYLLNSEFKYNDAYYAFEYNITDAYEYIFTHSGSNIHNYIDSKIYNNNELYLYLLLYFLLTHKDNFTGI